MDKRFNILISAFIAFGIYLLIILAFILYLKTPVIKKYQAISKNTVIELDLIIIDNKKDDKKTKQIKKNIVKKEIKIKKSSSSSAIKKTNLKSLFAKVDTKATKIKEKSALNIKKNEISSRFKSTYKKNKIKNDLKIKKFNDIKNSSKAKKITAKKNGEFDEYYSQINTILLTRWYKYPLFTKEEYLVKVKINISSKGLFSYNIISYSRNQNIDDAVNKFLKTQNNTIYPIPKDNKEKIIIINFINDKE